MKFIKKLLFPVLIVSGLLAKGGFIKGEVRDGATQQPLVGVNVIVQGTSLGTATDKNGMFLIPNIEPGFYHIRFEMIGYQPLVKMNVRVSASRGVFISAELLEQPIEFESVTVTRAYYQKEKDAFVSSRTVDFEEIRRDPAGAIDIQRMMQALPSVVSAADQENEIVVRGGAPGENLFLMDNIEISNPNHFGRQGTGGGPINMVNTLFVDRVDFIAGAFPAKYGDKVSSVMDIRLREGNRDFHSFDLDMGMAGVGFFAEGPIIAGRGSYMVSYRKSYLDLIIKQTGLTAVPKYWNTQAKLTFDINPTDKLIFNFIHGSDAIDLFGENVAQSRGAENVYSRGKQSAAGLTYKHLWKGNGLSRFTVAGTDAWFKYDVFRYNGKGIKNTYYFQDDTEWDIQVKGDFVWRVSPRVELSGGADLKQLGMDYQAWFRPDTVWLYEYNFPQLPDTTFAIIDRATWETSVFPIIQTADPDSTYLDEQDVWHYGSRNDDGSWDFVRVRRSEPLSTNYSPWSINRDESHPRYGGFLQAKWRPFLRLTVNLGLRIGYYEFTKFSWLSPRLGFSYRLSDRSSVNLAFGRHFQTPGLVLLGKNRENTKLKSKYTNQAVIGFEHFFTEDTRGTLELYWKSYHDIPVSLAVTTLDTADRSRVYVNKGEGRSYGVELFLQKKLAKDFFGTFSYSLYRAEARDPRYPNERKYYPWDFDFKNVLTAIGGYKIPLKGPGVKPLRKRNLLIRLIGNTIGWGAQELEFSFRYRYVGGKPYTPKVYNHLVRRWYETTGVDYNTKRFPPYHRFDIMILWHINFGSRMSLVSYFDLQNVFDRDNIWDLQYKADGTTDYIYQYKILPVGGFILEF
ncbi:MAG: TonB-dependent receptor [FCB group bacterium]|nr:TonB-dependent receptor [FCB group bacterium]